MKESMTAESIIVFSNGDRKMAANEEAIFSLLRRVYRAMREEMTPASNVEEEILSRVFPFFPGLVHSSLLCSIHEWIMEAMVVLERKGDQDQLPGRKLS